MRVNRCTQGKRTFAPNAFKSFHWVQAIRRTQCNESVPLGAFTSRVGGNFSSRRGSRRFGCFGPTCSPDPHFAGPPDRILTLVLSTRLCPRQSKFHRTSEMLSCASRPYAPLRSKEMSTAIHSPKARAPFPTALAARAVIKPWVLRAPRRRRHDSLLALPRIAPRLGAHPPNRFGSCRFARHLSPHAALPY